MLYQLVLPLNVFQPFVCIPFVLSCYVFVVGVDAVLCCTVILHHNEREVSMEGE